MIDFDLLHAGLLDGELAENLLSARLPLLRHLTLGSIDLILYLLLILCHSLQSLVLFHQRILDLCLELGEDCGCFLCGLVELLVEVEVVFIARV